MLALAAVAVCLNFPDSQGVDLQIRDNHFSYEFTNDGNAARWTDIDSKSEIQLEHSPEVEIETGDRPESASKVKLVADPSRPPLSRGHLAQLQLKSVDGSLGVTVTWEVEPDRGIMRKWVRIANYSSGPIHLLNLVLGRFPVGSAKVEGGDRGFPLYLNQEFFVSVAHPAGFAHVEGHDVVLRQYPGVAITPGGTFRSMEAIYGVAKRGEARKEFVDYVKSRMYRVVQHHDKAYATLEAFGGEEEGNFKYEFMTGISESFLRKHLAEVATSEKENGVQFDFYGLEFWHDRAGTLKEFDPRNFPHGFDETRDRILGLGMKPGLWIDSGNLPQWSIGENPAMRASYSVRDGVGSFCRASEPINQTYKDAFLYQINVNHAGLLKFDNLNANCVNPNHNHLPGPLYSTEAIYNGVIDFLVTVHKANPDVFTMLYWGYRSPWWLLYADTYFECGDQIEAASPAQYPTPYARDAVTQRLDQAQLKIIDTPWLGKDSLGVWLSDWAWNSGIGSTRWQEGAIMDMARGSLIFQIWTDANWLTPPERQQVATFIKLLKANPSLFANSRFILGNPNNAEPYGYSCSYNGRAFLSIDNACLKDSAVHLNLDHSLGLPDGKLYDLYRWYPHPAKLSSAGFQPVSHEFTLMMRPYEVDLIEIVPKGATPSLGENFVQEPLAQSFAEQTREIPVSVKLTTPADAKSTSWHALKPMSVSSSKGAKLSTRPDDSILASGANDVLDSYTIRSRASGRLTGLLLETLTDDSLPSRGPGRAVNGNFQLTNIRVQMGSQDVQIKSAASDFDQTSFGGWPASAAIDDNAKSAWSIHPQVGQDHAAAFRFEHPIDVAGDLTITLTNGENGHSLGRFRLSATSEPNPSLPTQYRPGRIGLSLSLPATKTGGLLLLVGGNPAERPVGSIPGRTLPLMSVWSSNSNWSCPWTAWRGEVGPSSTSRLVSIAIDRMRTVAGSKFTAYYLPK